MNALHGMIDIHDQTRHQHANAGGTSPSSLLVHDVIVIT